MTKFCQKVLFKKRNFCFEISIQIILKETKFFLPKAWHEIQTFLQNSSNLSCFVSEFHWIFIQHFWLSPEEPEFQLHFYPIGGWFLWFTKWNWMDWIDRNGSKKRSGFCYQWPFCCLWQINGIAMKTFVTGLQGSVKLFTLEILQL